MKRIVNNYYVVEQSQHFARWLEALKDIRGKIRIVAKIKKVKEGSLGDFKALGDGLFELRVHHGPGYRLYFTWHGIEIVFLLIGGDKSTQSRDIGIARKIKDEYYG